MTTHSDTIRYPAILPAVQCPRCLIWTHDVRTCEHPGIATGPNAANSADLVSNYYVLRRRGAYDDE